MSEFVQGFGSRSSGWSGAEASIPEGGSDYEVGRRAGINDVVNKLERWLSVLEAGLCQCEGEVFAKVRVQTVRHTIGEVERLL